ncbi:MAG: SAM-dependent methyltransferase [Planctomycetaceae bacterium]
MTHVAAGRSLPRRLIGMLPGLGRFAPPPEIRVGDFSRRHIELFAASVPREEGTALVSQLCRLATLDSPTFRHWLERLGDGWHLHRKNWEHAYICQALHERGLLAPGRRGLGFAVGAEKLPAFFAALGCRITATDLAVDDDRNQRWASSGQWTGNLAALNAHGLCPADVFAQQVEFRPVDMNDVPDDLRDYDFTWSTCSFEHCGSLELGLAFLERQLECLRPGGVAVHTTEFNLSSNDSTVARGPNVIYRLRDIEEFVARLVDRGHHVEPIDLDPGATEADRFIDPPPYHGSTGKAPGGMKHLRLNLDGYASTSIGLILRRAA